MYSSVTVMKQINLNNPIACHCLRTDNFQLSLTDHQLFDNIRVLSSEGMHVQLHVRVFPIFIFKHCLDYRNQSTLDLEQPLSMECIT